MLVLGIRLGVRHTPNPSAVSKIETVWLPVHAWNRLFFDSLLVILVHVICSEVRHIPIVRQLFPSSRQFGYYCIPGGRHGLLVP